MFARQRSGTGALGTVLGQQDDIKYLGEVFHDKGKGKSPNYFWWLQQDAPGRRTCLSILDNPRQKLHDYLTFLDEAFPEKVKVIDIKYRSSIHFNGYWHPPSQKPKLLLYLKQMEVPIIHLTRDNCLQTFVSGKLAEANRIWHARENDEIKVTALTLDPHQMMHHIKVAIEETKMFQDSLRGYKKTVCIDYEEIFGGSGIDYGPVKKIIDLLGLESMREVPPRFRKQAPRSAWEAIENLEDIRMALSATPYQWMFHNY